MRITSAARTAVVRDRQESERVCRMLLQEQKRLEEARCREHSQVSHCSTAALTANSHGYIFFQKNLIFPQAGFSEILKLLTYFFC